MEAGEAGGQPVEQRQYLCKIVGACGRRRGIGSEHPRWGWRDGLLAPPWGRG